MLRLFVAFLTFSINTALAMSPEAVTQAEALLEAKEYDKLRVFSEPLANQGDPDGMTYLALSYSRKKEYSTACDWHEKAAKKNQARAIGGLGICYEFGDRGTKNPKKAEALYLKAINLGWHRSAVGLGRLYQVGKLGKKDLPKAEKWLKYASDKGINIGSLLLAQLYWHEYKNKELLLKYARLAGERGLKKGWFLVWLNGTKEDKKEAKQYLTAEDIACIFKVNMFSDSLSEECR